MGEIVGMEQQGRWYTPTLEEKMEYAQYYGTDELHYCKHPWALRHYWVNKETGLTQRARCNRWECRHCGPRKVNLWRQLVKEAEPTLFLTLSKAGKTVEESRRALTTFMQALRRGSKGRGKNHAGMREAYPIEYFAVLEKHSDFERNGFHWHILIKGVEYIPYKEVLQPLWMSATHYRPATEEDEGQGAMIADIQRVRNARAIGYVTKYLMKALTDDERGTKQVKERHQSAVLEPTSTHSYQLKHDEQGEMVLEDEEVEVEKVSKAHRLCYSHHFFPEQVSELRKRLFAGVEHEVMGEAPAEETQEDEEEQEQQSSWLLMDRQMEEFVDVQAYKQERYAELAETLEASIEKHTQAYQEQKRQIVALVETEARELMRDEYRRLHKRVLREALGEGKPLSRRIINIWFYQCQQQRQANRAKFVA